MHRVASMTYADHLCKQREYAALCDKAREVGVPVSLDDPASPKTVAALREAVEKA